MVAAERGGAGRGYFADDIAYDAHDIDDGLRADLFALDDIAAVADRRRHLARDRRRDHPRSIRPRRVHETVRRLITRMIEDVIAETDRRVAAHKPIGRRGAQGRAGRWLNFHRR